MNAKTAQEISKANKDKCNKELLESIEKSIKLAANNGHYECTVACYCDKTSLDWLNYKLEQEGFDMDFEPQVDASNSLAHYVHVIWYPNE